MSKTNTAVKSAIRSTSETLQNRVHKTETFAIATVDQANDALGKARAGFEQAQEVGQNVANAAGEATRTAWNGTKEISSALAAHGKAALDDMISVGQKSFEVKSIQELVALQTEYATRRLHAGFEAANTVNGLAHAHAVALWSPIADAMRGAAQVSDEALPKSAKPAKAARKG